MASVEQAVQTQLNNIQSKAGKPLAELSEILRTSGLSKHSELRQMAMQQFGLSYGDANTLVHYALKSDGERAAEGKSDEAVLDEIYSGPKAGMRPIHEALMTEVNRFGAFESAPKNGYVSLRRKKQFATIGPATNTRFEVGLNLTGATPSDRLVEQPPGSMCKYKVKLTGPSEVDRELVDWLRQAYEGAG